MYYFCEHCFTEQDEPGWCKSCFQHGTTNLVQPLTSNTKGISLYDAADDIRLADEDWDTAYKNTKSAQDYGVYGDWSDVTAKDYPLSPVGSYSYKSWKKTPPRRAKAWKDHNFWFIGDVHNNVDEYLAALKDIREIDPNAITIQVGDIGLGESTLPPLGPKDFFIQGNHDNIKDCLKHPNFLGKFGYKHGVFFMGGAASKGVGFNGEELCESELEEAVRLYKHVKPEIVVTHDCPESLRDKFGGWGKPKNSRTCLALEDMWQAHNPNVWAFGHMHCGRTDNIDGTEFICLSPLESHQIRLGWVSGVQEYQKYSKPMEMTKTQAVTKWFKGLLGQ